MNMKMSGFTCVKIILDKCASSITQPAFTEFLMPFNYIKHIMSAAIMPVVQEFFFDRSIVVSEHILTSFPFLPVSPHTISIGGAVPKEQKARIEVMGKDSSTD